MELSRDLVIAARRLLATPSFTAFALLSLAVGVGVTTATYAVVDRVCWPPIGVSAPDAVVVVGTSGAGRFTPRRVSDRTFGELQRATSVLADTASSAPVVAGIDTGTAAGLERGEAVDGAYFGVLRIDVRIGRGIQAHDVKEAAAVVVLSHALWTSHYAASPEVVGRPVRLSGRTFVVIGVATEAFAGLGRGAIGATRFWIPIGAAGWLAPGAIGSLDGAEDGLRVNVIGRLRGKATVQQVGEFVRALGARIDTSDAEGGPSSSSSEPVWGVRTLLALNESLNPVRRFGVLVLGLVCLVLVVASTNLSNLVLARGSTRRHELSVRFALGASRGRLMTEQSLESMLLAVGGGVLALGVVLVLVRLLDVQVPVSQGQLLSIRPQLDIGAFVAAGCALLLSFAVIGLEPAIRLTRTDDLRTPLDAGTVRTGRPRVARQRRLILSQVAITTGLFILAAMGLRLMIAESRHDSGVDVDRLAMATVVLPPSVEPTGRVVPGVDRLLDTAARVPGVEAVAASTGMPFGTAASRADISPASSVRASDAEPETARAIAVTARYFSVAGIRILEGRPIDDRDVAGAPRTVVLSESTARKLLGTGEAVGREVLVRARLQGDTSKKDEPLFATVVGVAEDTDTGTLFSRSDDTLYLPLAQQSSPRLLILARANDASVALGALRFALNAADSEAAVGQMATARDMLLGQYVFLRTLGLLASFLGIVALVLAAAGIYGLESHLVASRRHELGLRMSLGATRKQVMAMVMKEGLGPVMQGLVLGFLLGLVGRTALRSLVMLKADIADPLLLLPPALIVSVAFWSCYLPAWRASRVQPNEALRGE